jgi:hypothetical protein
MADEAPKYYQDFFLDLALKGKDAWNKWRRDPANESERVTFQGIDFSESPRDRIDFSGFEFGNNAIFSGCTWRGVDQKETYSKAFAPGLAFFVGTTFGNFTNFSGAAFGDRANFNGATFGRLTKFRSAIFGGQAKFAPAIFGDGADFTGATFGLWADFMRATFGDRAQFTSATFGNEAKFTGVIFGNFANFEDAVFGDNAFFHDATFADTTNFEGTAFGWETSFAGATFRGDVEFKGKTETESRKDFELRVRDVTESVRGALKKRHEESWTGSGSGPDRFLTISFANAHFNDEAVFSVRTFEADADFTNTHFYYPPDFDAVTNASRIDFTGTRISFVAPSKLLHWTKNGRIPVRLRAFRKVAEETKNHDLERDLYIEERKAERGVYLRQRWEELKKDGWKSWPRNAARLVAHCFWILVMGLYWALADYGRNFVVPAIWLGLSVPLFHWRYSTVLAALIHEAGPANAERYGRVIWMAAFGNAVPFIGPLTIDAEIKKFLFCPGFGPCLPIPPEGFQCWLILQNVVSIVLVFFIGLALRNYFKIK